LPLAAKIFPSNEPNPVMGPEWKEAIGNLTLVNKQYFAPC
jgi:hypothetical protein